MFERRSRTVLSIVVVALLAGSMATAAPEVGVGFCDPQNPMLEGPPTDVAPQPTAAMPIRNDADGGRTLILSVEDPADGNPLTYQPLYTPPSGAPTTIREAGIWWHRWASSRPIVTHGVYVTDESGVRTRVPLFLTENAPDDSVTLAAAIKAFEEVFPTVFNAPPYALNTIAPTPGIAPLLALAPVAGPILAGAWWTWSNEYPLDYSYADRPPMYVWSAYRTAGNSQFWQGGVLMHNGSYGSSASDDSVARDACRRTRIGAAVRTDAGTTYGGGVFLLEHATGSETFNRSRSHGTFDAAYALTAGVTIGTSPSWTDVPLTSIKQSQRKEGDAPYLTQHYTDYQRDEIMLGVEGPAGFMPLIGTRSEARHTDAHCDEGDPTQGGDCPFGRAQHHLVSIGAYDPLGEYHAAVGVKTSFEWVPADGWPLLWALSGGPGTRSTGDWRADVGTFQPLGGSSFDDFVPLAGITYDDSLEDALYPYQMTITAGPWVGSSYVPAVGATYDGERPLVIWALMNSANEQSEMGRWLTSVGAFDPLGTYRPVAGASFARGSPGTYGDPRITHVEEYRVGAFTGSYPNFVPLAGANWAGSHSSAYWAGAYAGAEGRVPSFARVDVGPVTPVTGFVPVAGITAEPGDADRYGVGAWAAGGFVPLLEACHSRPNDGATVGVAAGGGSGRTPLAWGGFTSAPDVPPPAPSGGALQDCPS